MDFLENKGRINTSRNIQELYRGSSRTLTFAEQQQMQIIEKSTPVGTVNKYGKVKMQDGTWQYQKKGGTGNKPVSENDKMKESFQHKRDAEEKTKIAEDKRKAKEDEKKDDEDVTKLSAQKVEKLQKDIQSNNLIKSRYKCEFLAPVMGRKNAIVAITGRQDAPSDELKHIYNIAKNLSISKDDIKFYWDEVPQKPATRIISRR